MTGLYELSAKIVIVQPWDRKCDYLGHPLIKSLKDNILLIEPDTFQQLYWDYRRFLFFLFYRWYGKLCKIYLLIINVDKFYWQSLFKWKTLFCWGGLVWSWNHCVSENLFVSRKSFSVSQEIFCVWGWASCGLVQIF